MRSRYKVNVIHAPFIEKVSNVITYDQHILVLNFISWISTAGFGHKTYSRNILYTITGEHQIRFDLLLSSEALGPNGYWNCDIGIVAQHIDRYPLVRVKGMSGHIRRLKQWLAVLMDMSPCF